MKIILIDHRSNRPTPPLKGACEEFVLATDIARTHKIDDNLELWHSQGKNHRQSADGYYQYREIETPVWIIEVESLEQLLEIALEFRVSISHVENVDNFYGIILRDAEPLNVYVY